MGTSRGCLIFAYNNETIDYEKIALLNAKLIRKHLGVDTTIVTGNKETQNTRAFRYHDNEIETVAWHNTDRMTAYDQSPYDETILLDADYLILSNNLNNFWGNHSDFLCPNRVYDVTGTDSFHSDKNMSKTSFPMRWATCIYFRKTPFAKSVFDMMEQIRDNYGYYSMLFGFRADTYRNDFALSIALQILSGYTDRNNHFHFPLASVSTYETIKSVRQDGTFVIQYKHGESKALARVKGLDLHIMNKKQLFDVYDDITSLV